MKRYKEITVWLGVFIFCIFVLSVNYGVCQKETNKSKQESTETKKNIPAQQSQPQQPQTNVVNPITQAAVNRGVLTAADRINDIANYFSVNSQTGAYLFIPKERPNEQMVSISFEISPKNTTTTMYASASFAPYPNTGVNTVYEIVEYIDDSPSNVESKIFKNIKRVGTIRKGIAVFSNGKTTFFLMPAGKGSIVIRKEVIY